MKKTVSVLLTLLMLSGVFAVAPITADAALSSTQIDMYKKELNYIRNNKTNGNISCNDIEKCSFTIVDANDDGMDDLVVRLDQAPMSGTHSNIYTIKNNKVKQIGCLYGSNCCFYKNGYVVSKAALNKGPGDTVWPYSISKYNSSTQNFEYFANARSADRDYPYANTPNGYYSYPDTDNDGVIHLVSMGSDEKVYTKSEYNAFVNKYIPNKNQKTVTWQKITSANVNNLGNPASVKLNRGTLSLGVGESYGLVKTISPDFAKQSVSWTSSKSAVAAVDKNGKVTGKKPGTATVTVKTSNGKTASCKVTVKPAPKSIKINTPKLKMGAGENVYIKETTNKGSYANAANLKWTSSNSSVAGVAKIEKTNQAVVYSQYTGNATIKVKTYNGKTSSCGVTVYSMPRSVKLSKYSITLKKGQSYTISETTNKGSYAHPSNISWVSYNSKVATVKKGSGNKATIKAVGKGKTTVAVGLYNRLIAECTVTVK